MLPLLDKPDEVADGEACSPACSAAVKRCNGTWCRYRGDGFDGWVAQERLWGVYPDEKIE